MSGALDTPAERVGLWEASHEEGGGLAIRVDESDLADLADVVAAAKCVPGLRAELAITDAREARRISAAKAEHDEREEVIAKLQAQIASYHLTAKRLASEAVAEEQAKYGRELQQALTRIANLEAEKQIAVAEERKRVVALLRESLHDDGCGTDDVRDLLETFLQRLAVTR